MTPMQPPTRNGPASPWRSGPSRPRLQEGDLHVWRADLTSGEGQLDELLSRDERARAARLLSEDHRARWTRSRGLLRTLLGLYLQADPGALALIADANGKPSLADAGGEPATRLSFNLSHSGSLALFAFSAGAAVGVDVEADRRAMDEAAIAARALGAGAAASLLAISDAHARRREFLRLWTRYEAELKCLGTGIGAAAGGVADAAAADAAAADAAAADAAAADPAGSSGPVWICELDLGTGAAGAVACTREPRELRCWVAPVRAKDTRSSS